MNAGSEHMQVTNLRVSGGRRDCPQEGDNSWKRRYPIWRA